MANDKSTQRLYALGMFLGVSVLCGLLLAGLAFPLASAAGAAAKVASDSIDQIPADFEVLPTSQRSRLLMADGSELAQFYNEYRVNVSLDEISPYMQQAQIAVEDQDFYQHGAINLEGILRAFLRNSRSGEVTGGGSTLTQQYVKMMLVERAVYEGDEEAQHRATEESIERKIREMRYAIALEDRLTKDEILEGYLNIAYYGDGAYGVEAAAHHYFNTTAAELTIAQSAMLAGIVQNPSNTDPVNNPQAALNRRSFVLGQMQREGYITEEERAEADAEEFNKKKVQKDQEGCFSAKYPQVCSYVEKILLSDEMSSLGSTVEERQNVLNRGGLTIKTSIDPDVQKGAQDAIKSLVKPTDPVISTSVLLEPSSGLIQAMAQSRPKQGASDGETYFNYAVDAAHGGAEGYQGGSTFKIFTMAAAFEAGYPATKTYDAPATLDMKGQTFTNCTGPVQLFDSWPVSNSGYDYGVIDMYQATTNSVNTYYSQLIRDVGICESIKAAERLGLETSTGASLMDFQNPTFVLGQVEVTPLSLTESFATIANRGVHCEPRILVSIKAANGSEIAVPDEDCERVIDEDIADAMTKLLTGPLKSGTARSVALPYTYSQAGKTGTTPGNGAIWLAGFTPELAGTAMIAVDKNSSFWSGRSKTLNNLTLPSGTFIRGFGGTDAGKIWRASMLAGLEGKKNTTFNEPTSKVLNGVKVAVPSVSGMSLEQAKKTLENAGFTTTVVYVYSDYAQGTFLGTAQSGSQPKFSTIGLRVSKGPEPAPEPEPADDDGEDQPSRDDDEEP